MVSGMEKIDNTEEYVQQAKMLVTAQKFEEASNYAERALGEDPMCFDAWVVKGIALTDLESYSEAAECFQKAAMIDKNASAPHYHLGIINFIQGNVEEGIKESNQAIELGYDEQDIYFNLGLVYEGEGDDDKAIRYYSKAIRKDELNPYPHLRKAMVYLNSMRYEEGLEALEELRRFCPDCYEGYHYAAAAYIAMGNSVGAEQILNKAEETFNEDADILIDHIKVLVAQGKYEEAMEKVEQGEKLAKSLEQKKQLLLCRAKVIGIQERFDEAIRLLEQAQNTGKDEENDAEIGYLLINAYLMREDYAKIKEQAEKLSILPDTNTYALGAQYYLAMAEAKLNPDNRQNLFKKAAFHYRSLTLQHPNRIEAYLFRALCYRDLEEYEKALEMVNYVENFTSSIPSLDTVKAEILKAMGKNGQAEALLRDASEKGEEIAKILLENKETAEEDKNE